MLLSLDKCSLFCYTVKQINNFFPDGEIIKKLDVAKYESDTLSRLYTCFKGIKKPYFYKNNRHFFNHLNSDQYAMFLYIFSNTIWQIDRNEVLASKVFLLNKMLHGIDAFYGISLPDIFIFVHPLGTVLGNAKYSNYLAIYQNCTVGATEELIYPTFEGETLLYSKSTIIGKCHVGANTVLGANCFIINTNIGINSIVVNSYPNHRVLPNDTNIIDRIFR